jgi:hypothetical protein
MLPLLWQETTLQPMQPLEDDSVTFTVQGEEFVTNKTIAEKSGLLKEIMENDKVAIKYAIEGLSPNQFRLVVLFFGSF